MIAIAQFNAHLSDIFEFHYENFSEKEKDREKNKVQNNKFVNQKKSQKCIIVFLMYKSTSFGNDLHLTEISKINKTIFNQIHVFIHQTKQKQTLNWM